MQAGFPVPADILLSGAAGAILAAFLIPTFRLKGLYFAVGSFVVPYMVKPLVEVLGGSSAFRVPAAEILSPSDLYYTGLALALAVVFVVYLVMKSKLGLALRTLGDDEVAAASIGANVVLYKAMALMISGCIAAIAGLYYAEIAGTAETTVFQNLAFSLLPVFMVVIGGAGSLEGPIIGALLFSGLNYFVTSQFPGSTFDTFVLSLSIVAVALYRPRGLVPRRSKG